MMPTEIIVNRPEAIELLLEYTPYTSMSKKPTTRYLSIWLSSVTEMDTPMSGRPYLRNLPNSPREKNRSRTIAGRPSAATAPMPAMPSATVLAAMAGNGEDGLSMPNTSA